MSFKILFEFALCVLIISASLLAIMSGSSIRWLYRKKTSGVFLDEEDLCLKCDHCKAIVFWYSDICTDEELSCSLPNGDLFVHPPIDRIIEKVDELKECPVCGRKLIFAKNFSCAPGRATKGFDNVDVADDEVEVE